MRENIRLDAKTTTSGYLCELTRLEQQIQQDDKTYNWIMAGVCLSLMAFVYLIAFWPEWKPLLFDVRLRWFLLGVGATVLSLVTVLVIGVCIGVGRIKEHPSL